MIERQLLLALILLGPVSRAMASPQEQPPPDPQIQQFEEAASLLRQGRLAAAERLLDEAQLRMSQSKFKLGNP
jgi:hypothetical protein